MPVSRPWSLLVLLTVGPAFAAAPPADRRDRYGDPLPPGAVARMGSVRWRAREGGRHPAFLPDGKHLVTSSWSVLSLWDIQTGRVVRTIRDDVTPLQNGFVGGFAFTPDGKRLLSADEATRMLFWEYPSGKLLSQSPGLGGGHPICLALRRDGRMSACGTHYGDVLIWTHETNALRRVMRGTGRKSIHRLAFSRDGKHLIVMPGSGDASERVQIDVASGKVLNRVDLGGPSRHAIAPNDGVVATYVHPDQLFLFDASSGKKRRLPWKEKDAFLELSFSRDGQTLLAMDRAKETVWFLDVAKGQLLRQLRLPGLGRTDEHVELQFSGDGKWLASIEEYSVVRLWDARTGQPRHHLPAHAQPPGRLAFSPDGKELVSYSHQGNSPGGEVFRWETATGKLLARVVPQTADDYLPGWDTKWLLAPGGRNVAQKLAREVRLYETRTGKRLVLRDRDYPVTTWTFTPDGSTLVTTSLDRSLRFWDATTGKLVRRLGLGMKSREVSWICFTADGRTVATGEGHRKVHLWDVATGKLRTMLSLPAMREPFQPTICPWQTAFSPNGRCLFLSNSTNLWIWDVVSGNEIGPFEEDEYGFRVVDSGQVDVSVDGRLLAWFDSAGKLCLYEIATGQIVHRFAEGHSAIAFAPSGWQIATGCHADASILIWDLPTIFRSGSPPRTPSTLEALWEDLSAPKAMHAYRSLWRLTALPEADAFLARRLSAVERVPVQRLRVLIADLGNDDFATRQKAEQALGELGEAGSAALVEAHQQAKDLEQRQRLARLLNRLQPRAADRLREARAVMVLEVRGTPEARRLLRRLACGLPEARLTREATVALQRLIRRPGNDQAR